MQWLLDLNLGRYAARLASDCGVQTMAQLLNLKASELRRCGLKVLEERRLMRAISEAKAKGVPAAAGEEAGGRE
eukprot:SAG22_NODE_2470_length_2538_cov_1.675277_2_plen_74_part_00